MSDIRAGHDGDLGYHQRMLADHHRMVAYERALRGVIKPGDVVLDVGAGTGVLSLWAARLGAKVHAVESMNIGSLIAPLAFHHGVGDRVTVHRADMRMLPIVEPVDWIISECLGRFLVDDGMLEAMEAAALWLKPGGRILPGRVELVVAPVELGDFAPLDTWLRPLLGLDFSPLAPFAAHQTYGMAVEPWALLAEPQLIGTWTPPEPVPVFHDVTFELSRAGNMRGLVGWFRAHLTPEVMLTNAPGYETHWQQLLFPLPTRQVAAGERVRVRIESRPDLPGDANYPTWRWSAARLDRDEELSSYDGGRDISDIMLGRDPLDLNAIQAEGEAAFERGAYDEAAKHFSVVANAQALRTPDLDADWENVGIALHSGHRYAAAIAPLMRALDGGLAREQSLRLLVDCCFRVGNTGDAKRWLEAYERTYGPHPAGWSKD